MKRRLPRSLLLASVCSAAALALACDAATPTAPTGTILTISANPSQIGINGNSQITVIGRRPDGNPLNPGTEIFFSTSIGSVAPTVVAVDDDGVARATLRGDGRVGTANVTASTSTSGGGGGGGEEGEGGGGPSTGIGSATVSVTVGRNAGSVSLQSSPSSVTETGETQTLRLLAVVRDSNGQPLADTPVNFQTELGTLASGGSFRFTNAAGEVRDTLTVTPEQLSTVSIQNFQVTAQASGEGGAVIEDTFNVRIDRPLVADFTFERQGLQVSFFDESTGTPTSWVWSFGDDTPTSTEQNPTHTYASGGTYRVTLTVRNARDTDAEGKDVTVPP